MVAIFLLAAAGCATEPALQRLSDARGLAAELLMQFTKSADATNRVVMADTEEAAAAFARESGQATQGVQRHAETLKPLLSDLGYSPEIQLLDEFSRRFADYRVLDQRILALAVETPTSRRGVWHSGRLGKRSRLSANRWRPSPALLRRQTVGASAH